MTRRIFGIFIGAVLFTTLAAQGRASAAPAIVYQGFAGCGRPVDWVAVGQLSMIQTGFTSSPVRQNPNFVVGTNADTSVAVESTVTNSSGKALVTVIATSTSVSSAQFWLNKIATQMHASGCL